MPPLARITIDAIVGFDLVGFFVAGLAPLVVVLGIGRRPSDERTYRAGGRTGAEHAKELTTPQTQLVLRFHSASSGYCAPVHPGSANASVSISINSRPTVPTWR